MKTFLLCFLASPKKRNLEEDRVFIQFMASEISVHGYLVLIFLEPVVGENITAGRMWWDKAGHLIMKEKERREVRVEKERDL